MAAVSVRRMVSPNETDLHPAPSSIFTSSSVQPPSGPTASASEFFAQPGSSNSPTEACASFSLSSSLQSLSKVNTSFNADAAEISGGRARRDCSDASRAIRRQRSTRLPAAAARCASVRRATSGTMPATPNSVSFSIAHSMRSNFITESNTVICGAEGARTISPSSNSTRSSATESTRPRRS